MFQSSRRGLRTGRRARIDLASCQEHPTKSQSPCRRPQDARPSSPAIIDRPGAACSWLRVSAGPFRNSSPGLAVHLRFETAARQRGAPPCQHPSDTVELSSHSHRQTHTMQQPLSNSKRRWLLDQLQQWQHMGLVTNEQSLQIVGQYQSPEDAAASRQTRAMNVLMGVAALLVVTGVLLIISFNWEPMPTLAKLTLIFSMVLGTYLLAFLARQRGRIDLSNVCFFLGASFYGCGIMLIGQIFHVDGEPSAALWWWAIGTWPIVICQESLLLHALLVGLVGLWCFAERTALSTQDSESLFGVNLLTQVSSILLFAGPSIALAYRRKQASLLRLYVPLLSWWLSLICDPWWFYGEYSHCRQFFVIASVGGLLLLVAQAQPRNSDLATPWLICGVVMAGVAMLITSSFNSYGDDQWNWHWAMSPSGLWIISVVLMVLAIVVPLVAARSQGQWTNIGDLLRSLKVTLRRDFVLLGYTLCMAAAAVQPYEESAVTRNLELVFVNLCMLAGSLWLLLVGLRDDRGLPFVLGLLYLLLWITSRYFDLFGKGMLTTALFFFACAGLLFGIVAYWRYRHRKREVLA